MIITQELTMVIGDRQWLTDNQRINRFARMDAVKALRQIAFYSAKAKRLRKMKNAHITAYIKYRTKGEADPNNTNPTLKALIDGLTRDYGLLPDDSSKYLVGPDMRRDDGVAEPGTHEVRLVIKGEPA